MAVVFLCICIHRLLNLFFHMSFKFTQVTITVHLTGLRNKIICTNKVSFKNDAKQPGERVFNGFVSQPIAIDTLTDRTHSTFSFTDLYIPNVSQC